LAICEFVSRPGRGAAAGIDADESGRPIGVADKTAKGITEIV
jgi:hypothetical protein